MARPARAGLRALAWLLLLAAAAASLAEPSPAAAAPPSQQRGLGGDAAESLGQLLDGYRPSRALKQEPVTGDAEISDAGENFAITDGEVDRGDYGYGGGGARDAGSGGWWQSGAAAASSGDGASSGSGDGAGASGGGGGGGAPGAEQGVTFKELHPELGDNPDVQHLMPTVHGFVEKKGILHWSSWWNHKKGEERFDSFLSYRLNRSANGGPGPASAESYTCAGADHPRLPFPGCHVFLNHKYRMIYIRSPKSASSSIVDELGECNNHHTRNHNKSTCIGMHAGWEHYFYKDLQNVTNIWRDYFVFGFVRNPWKRAYSLFKYMQSDGCMSNEDLLNPRCLKTRWKDFCVDPWGSMDRVHDQGCLKRSKSYMYFHMMDQYHCMVTDTGDWAVDYIGRVEQFNEDWAEVVERINSKRDPNATAIPVRALMPKNTRLARSFKDPFTGENSHCLDAVSRWHACDIDKFGYVADASSGLAGSHITAVDVSHN